MKVIKQSLEKIIGEERFNRVKDSKAYNAVIEAFALNSFSYAFAVPNELLIAGMDFSEHIKTRALAAITNTIFGRPYGVYRDWLLKKCKVHEKSHWSKKYLADTAAFVSFQVPLYWFNMAVGGGAEVNEMIAASATISLVAGATGRPYGAYLDFVRDQSGIKPGYIEDQSKQ